MSEPIARESLTPNIDLEKLKTQFDLTGAKAFVPGGYGALGAAICWALAVQGADVAIAGPKGDKAEALAESIRAAGYRASGYALDAKSVPAIESVTAKIAGDLGGIDILVNCVGIQREQKLLEVTEETFDLMYETNLKAGMFLGQAVARIQIESGTKGRHIHLLSVRSQLALRGRGYSAYCSTKGGLLMLVKQHAMELAPHGITVNGVAPTFIQSDRIKPHLDKAEFRDFILDRNPLGRIGDPIEVTGPIITFAAPAGGYITGQVIYVDGGVTASQ